MTISRLLIHCRDHEFKVESIETDESGDNTIKQEPETDDNDSFLDPYEVKEETVKQEDEMPRALRDTPMTDDDGSTTPRAKTPCVAVPNTVGIMEGNDPRARSLYSIEYTPVPMVGDETPRERTPNSEPLWCRQYSPNPDASPTPFFDAPLAAAEYQSQRPNTEESDGLGWFMDRRSCFSESTTASVTPTPGYPGYHLRTPTPFGFGNPDTAVDQSFVRDGWVDHGVDAEHPMKVEEDE
ncbi:hypothetical protein P7C71_g4022, partial [Lecanoromycetidae sp. Uapishka_2]